VSDQIRRALTFDPDLYAYIEEMRIARKQPFATVCASMLREIMNDAWRLNG
jgi:hypothetical protein